MNPKGDSGFSITSIDLATEVTAAGIDAEKFQAVAAETKKNCPVGKVLAATTINLKATLKAG